MIKAGVDWGSSSFRAYRFDESGRVIDTLSTALGIKFVSDDLSNQHKGINKFEHTFLDLIGHWLEPGDTVLLSGMITSVNGWCETPYLECPVSLSAITAQMTEKQVNGISLQFLPGVCQRSPKADVMRGEELQLIGALQSREKTTMVMPGTHSKWAIAEQDSLLEFRTIATGELFDVLLNHSLIGQLATGDQWRQERFIEGVATAYHSGGIVSELFACRSGVLLNSLEALSVSSYLSGLLIGNEIREGMAITGHSEHVTLIGNNSLCTHYRDAFQHLSLAADMPTADAAESGFVKLIKSQPTGQH